MIDIGSGGGFGVTGMVVLMVVGGVVDIGVAHKTALSGGATATGSKEGKVDDIAGLLV